MGKSSKKLVVPAPKKIKKKVVTKKVVRAPKKITAKKKKKVTTKKVGAVSKRKDTILYCGNLSFSITEEDVIGFFKSAGQEVVDVRFATDSEDYFMGFGRVEFATAEAAQKSLELAGQSLCGRPIKFHHARDCERDGISYS